MPGPESILLGAGVPALVAGALLLVAWRGPGWADPPPASGAWATALAVAAGALAGHVALSGVPAFPPPTAEDWVPWLAVAALVAAVGEARRRADDANPAWTGRTLLVAAVLATVLRPMTRYTWSWAEAAVAFVALAAVLLGWNAALAFAVDRVPARSSWAMLTVAAGGAALVLGMGGSVILGQRGGALAAALAAGAAVSWLRPGHRPPTTLVPVLTAVLGGLLLAGVHYAEVPRGAAVLVLLGPVIAAVPPPRTTRGPFADLAIRCVLAGILVAAAMAWTWSASPPLEPYY